MESLRRYLVAQRLELLDTPAAGAASVSLQQDVTATKEVHMVCFIDSCSKQRIFSLQHEEHPLQLHVLHFISILYLPAFLLLRSSCMPTLGDLCKLTAGRHVCMDHMI